MSSCHWDPFYSPCHPSNARPLLHCSYWGADNRAPLPLSAGLFLGSGLQFVTAIQMRLIVIAADGPDPGPSPGPGRPEPFYPCSGSQILSSLDHFLSCPSPSFFLSLFSKFPASVIDGRLFYENSPGFRNFGLWAQSKRETYSNYSFGIFQTKCTRRPNSTVSSKVLTRSVFMDLNFPSHDFHQRCGHFPIFTPFKSLNQDFCPQAAGRFMV